MPLRTPAVLWLSGTAVSLLGTQAMAFALLWSAAAGGAPLAALTLTAVTLPRALLLLPAGAIADRLGAWRVLVAADTFAAAATLLFALLLAASPTTWWLIPLAALATGLADVAHLPASATVPRLLTDATNHHLTSAGGGLKGSGRSTSAGGRTPGSTRAGRPRGGSAAGAAPVEAGAARPADGRPDAPTAVAERPGTGLSRLMAGRQIAAQTAALAGPALGGLLVTAVGPAPVMAANAATFAAMVIVLLRLRPFLVPAPPTGAPNRAAAADRAGAADRVDAGLRLLLADVVLRPALALTAVAAGFLLPVSGLLLPLLARERHWSAADTGLLAGALAAGTGAVAVLVLARGTLGRPGRVVPGGLLLAAAGAGALAPVADPWPAALAALLAGAGSGLFATHVGPLFLARVPATHLARTQSVVVLAQTLPLLVTNTVLGALAGTHGVPPLLVGCAVVLAVAAGAGARALRAV
ncbi:MULTISPECIES: MFS transporter [Catenuloplanes]|uniref:MFS family permease n=1 Tax=Catenuloplanes niger TaxID=587534 RepID=A0AAE3ZVF9_9ACTN|nr:MFS transporter [Catenuloplanes niger]MDR7326521.1 MFS family permease [Catenuloplanes niger]